MALSKASITQARESQPRQPQRPMALGVLGRNPVRANPQLSGDAPHLAAKGPKRGSPSSRPRRVVVLLNSWQTACSSASATLYSSPPYCDHGSNDNIGGYIVLGHDHNVCDAGRRPPPAPTTYFTTDDLYHPRLDRHSNDDDGGGGAVNDHDWQRRQLLHLPDPLAYDDHGTVRYRRTAGLASAGQPFRTAMSRAGRSIPTRACTWPTRNRL